LISKLSQGAVVRTLQNFGNGKKVSATSDKVQDLINPATGEVFAKAPVSNASDVDKAMQAAASAFEVWKESTPGERQKAINKIADDRCNSSRGDRSNA
jgi:betaine-aldehyde dehydrogenase